MKNLIRIAATLMVVLALPACGLRAGRAEQRRPGARRSPAAEANYGIADKASGPLADGGAATPGNRRSRTSIRGEPNLWCGKASSIPSYADAHGGLGALGAAKKARDLFEQAISTR